MKRFAMGLVLLCALPIFAAESDKPLNVYTTFYPISYFTEQIGGRHVHVTNPLPENEDGAFWVPSREIVKQYHAADLIVMNGTNFEQGFNKVTLPESKIVNSTSFLKGQEVILEDPVSHAHGVAGMHTHQGMDGHTWVDPRTAKKQAQVIADALTEKRPAQAADFKANLDSLNRRFDALDKLIREKIVPAATGKEILAAHPAYNYLARSYGLKIKSFHMDPAETPAKEELESIAKYLKDHPAAIILWEDAPKPENEKLMKDQFKLASVAFSPCEALEKEDAKEGRNYFDVMTRNIEALAAALNAVK